MLAALPWRAAYSPAAARQGRILILSIFFNPFISLFVLFNHNTFQLQTLVNVRINNTFFYFCLSKNPYAGGESTLGERGRLTPLSTRGLGQSVLVKCGFVEPQNFAEFGPEFIPKENMIITMLNQVFRKKFFNSEIRGSKMRKNLVKECRF